jgi:predicted transcriptional regulator
MALTEPSKQETLFDNERPRRRSLFIDTARPDAEVERVVKGLASEPRLAILRHLSNHTSSINEIAKAVEMPHSTVAMHINILEEAGLVYTELIPASRGQKKVCSTACDSIVIMLPGAASRTENILEYDMPIGAYTDCEIAPTCGLASAHDYIGALDSPASFYFPDRTQAQILWFRHGFVEYRFPQQLPANTLPELLQISAEMCSEAPLYANDWLSDVTMWINGREIGTWVSPGDFGDEPGTLTPAWWDSRNTQYGLLKLWKVTSEGSFIDGVRISDIRLENLEIHRQPYISLRIGVKADAENMGGLNLFGRHFGNYPQDLHLRLLYHPA